MDSQGHWSSEIRWMIQHRDACLLTIDRTTDVTPMTTSSIAVSTRLAIRSQETNLRLVFPFSIPPHSHATVAIFFEYQRTRRGTLLRGDDIKHEVVAAEVINSDIPVFIERRLGRVASQGDIFLVRSESCIHWTTPRFANLLKINSPGRITNIPKVWMLTFKLGLGPGKPDPVVMVMI